jgi:hypothetical protein
MLGRYVDMNYAAKVFGCEFVWTFSPLVCKGRKHIKQAYADQWYRRLRTSEKCTKIAVESGIYKRRNRIARGGQDLVAANAKKQTWVMVVLCIVRLAHGWCQLNNEA